jgi:hypothetical protein
MQQDHRQKASARVVEHPREDDGQGNGADEKGAEGRGGAEKARFRSVVAGDVQVERQMPNTVQYAEP